ncbi:putative SAM-dependent methyltransferase [Tothia fuscella]|uniref:SAM-dependent methyltransferase n=1 Tax=Tothia fuscella TaxID=1048955 RepID=A0A9P4TW78_9PEZI|nr:putative SAM-dependent methyltransferase [Tothia fuscella]
MSIPPGLAESLAAKCLCDSLHSDVQLGQTRHRIKLVNAWQISSGSNVLEIGCGQGDCTAVLASVTGESGHVDAIDPAPLSYGSPWTLGQAQSHLSNGDLGGRISWHQTSPIKFLESVTTESKYDVAVLAHCIWYFPTRTVLVDIARALRGKAKRVCVAEYALSASVPEAMPHVLVALAAATLEAHRTKSDSNIQSVISPREISDIFEAEGWKLKAAQTLTPEQDYLDGSWEVGSVKDKSFLKSIDENIDDERVRLVLRSMRDAVIASISCIKVARTQDVWIASFE